MQITSRGVGVLSAAAVLLLTGLRFGYAELTVLGAAALIALGCALAHAGWLPRLTVTRVAEPDRVARGDAATMTLTVANRGRLRSTSLVAQDRCGRTAVAVPLLRLRPGRDTTVSYPVPTTRRGVIPVGPLRVTVRDALGLITLARSQGPVAQVWVHPRIHPLGSTPAGLTRSMDGRIDRVPHGSITFDALREYVVGDELRRVHWRTSARVGELMVREHLDTSLPRLVVLLDDRASAHPGVTDGVAETFESACEAAASVVAAAHRDALPVTMLLVADATRTDPPAGDGGTGPASGTGPTSSGGTGSSSIGGSAGTSFLDRLAAATLHGEAPGRRIAGLPLPGAASPAPGEADDRNNPGALEAATNRLRRDRFGDTLIFLTGPGAKGDLGRLGALRATYPSLVVGIFGLAGAAPAGVPGMTVIAAEDGAEFAAEWDGVRRW